MNRLKVYANMTGWGLGQSRARRIVTAVTLTVRRLGKHMDVESKHTAPTLLPSQSLLQLLVEEGQVSSVRAKARTEAAEEVGPLRRPLAHLPPHRALLQTQEPLYLLLRQVVDVELVELVDDVLEVELVELVDEVLYLLVCGGTRLRVVERCKPCA